MKIKIKIKQAWKLWIHRADGSGYGRGFEGTHEEAKAQAKKEAGTGGFFTVKGDAVLKPYNPIRRHSRPQRGEPS